MAGGRTGLVFLEDFDVGLAESIGGELVNVMFDEEEVQVYGLRVPNVEGPSKYSGLVPIIMSDGEDAYSDKILPQIVISRSDFTADMQRWQPGGHEYMVPAHGSQQVTSSGGLRGPNRVEIKTWSIPYEIPYDVHLRARTRTQGDRILRQVGKVLWKYGQVWIRDSEGEERGYYAFQENIGSLAAIDDVAERTQGHTISLRVEGELDFMDPTIAPTTPNLMMNVNQKPVSGPLRARR